MTRSRTAGIGLAAFAVLTVLTAILAPVPGGSYRPDVVTDYLAQGNQWRLFLAAYLGIAGLLGLMLFGRGIRDEFADLGDVVWGLALAALATGTTGWFLGAGVAVATAEGGPEITAGIPLPIGHTIGEIAGLLGGCAPGLFIGIIAVLCWRTGLPLWFKLFATVAGVCGILAPLYFTFFFFLLWCLVAGVFLAVRRAPAERRGKARRPLPAPVLQS
ncbi:hypothetical protein [Granulicoccus phenolivorans]|uniref:hypothetical protein n=1 Tax=Granulicoccus phenolivorans TaxID=266854 RepID=UPI00041EFBB4|nr:hypothetical protein [Granulicoccus phenolivorans]